MKKSQFWMVKGTGPADYVHTSKASAEIEARRLARNNPGQEFFVLEAVTSYQKIDVQRLDLRDQDADEDLPF